MSVTTGFSFANLRILFAMKPRRQLREMYFFLLLFSLAAALVTVFEPIFFYTLGIPVWQICLYYALHYCLYVVLMPIGGMFSALFGYERSLTLSTPLFVLYFLILAGLPSEEQLFWVAWVVLTAFKVFYWPAYHATFASYTDLTNRGTEQSWVGLLEYGAAVVGPLFGGTLAYWYGFPALFLGTALLVAVAGGVLLRTRERSGSANFSYLGAWYIIFTPRHRHMVVGMLGWGENLVYLAIWPVFLLITLGDVSRVGVVVSMSAFLATLVGFLVGELTDRISAKRMLRFAVPAMVGSYFVRLFVALPWQAVMGDILARAATVSVTIPFLSRVYRQARRVGVLEYAVAFETMLAVGKAVTALILMGVFFFLPLPTAFVIAFALAAALALFYRAL